MTFSTSKSALVLLGFLGVAGFLLWSEHKAHIISALPYLLLGGCVIMYLFMHNGHSGDGGHGVGRRPPGNDNNA